MAMTRGALTEADIRTLVRGSENERAAAAQKLCRRIEAFVDVQDREAAAEVLRLMASDAAELVRRALAVTLKQSTILPHDVALKLAQDVDSVAVPILNGSPVLSDDDLAEIVKASGAMKQIAVSRRAAVSDAVGAVLVRHGCEEAVKAVCANDNADLSERTLSLAIDRFGGSEEVASAIAFRRDLPLAIAERLVGLVTDRVRQHLVDHYALSPQTALEIALGTHERVTIDLVEQAQRTGDLKAFVAHLHRQERLTPSLLLRAVAHGDIAFFEWALAELTGISHQRAWLMVHDAGPLGLRAIYERADLPKRLFPAFRIAVDTYQALHAEGGATDLVRFQERMLQRFLTQPHSAAHEDIDYLLERMDKLGQARRASARAQTVKGAA